MIDPTSISVVIPTWNEAAWLDANLRVLTKIPIVGEVIVADSNSSDSTREVALRFGCEVTAGGRPGLARNLGRIRASSGLILFLDADTFVDTQSVTNAALTLRENPHLAAVNFRVKPLSRRLVDHIAYSVAAFYLRSIVALGIGQGLGNAILVRAADFDLVGGFSEDVEVGEDADFFYRLQKTGRYVEILTKEVAWTSPRRLKLEGRARFFSKVVVWAALRMRGSRATVFPYVWMTYPSSWAAADLRELQRRLKR